MAAPIIGITVDTNQGQEGKPLVTTRLRPGGDTVYWLKRNYVEAVAKSGGVPILIPVNDRQSHLRRYLAMIDGLLLSGGDFDIDPSFYGEDKIEQCGCLKPDRTRMEFYLFRQAMKRGIPVLGVCGGHQVINVALKGSLYQDTPTQLPAAIRHSQTPIPASQPSHTVRVAPGTALAKITGKRTLKVNSTHHQAIKTVGKGLVAAAVAPDGIVEAIAPTTGSTWALGVQWHPEALFDSDEPSRRIFARFVKAARRGDATIRR
jgi:putative glutamine amidotransferase